MDSCFLTTEDLKEGYLKPGLNEIVRQINETEQQCSVKMCKIGKSKIRIFDVYL
jgi:hypothetical protein